MKKLLLIVVVVSFFTNMSGQDFGVSAAILNSKNETLKGIKIGTDDFSLSVYTNGKKGEGDEIERKRLTKSAKYTKTRVSAFILTYNTPIVEDLAYVGIGGGCVVKSKIFQTDYYYFTYDPKTSVVVSADLSLKIGNFVAGGSVAIGKDFYKGFSVGLCF